MQKMVVCGVLGLVVACGGGQKPAQEPAKPAISNTAPAESPAAQPTSMYEEGLVAMKKYRDLFCACSDASCATHVSDDMTKWAQEASARWGPETPKLSDEQSKELQDVGQKMAECMQRAMTAGSSQSGGGGNPCGGP